MKKLLAVVGIVAVLAVLAGVAVTLTSDRRTAGARKNSERAAAPVHGLLRTKPLV